jgi:membrane-bound ClpP family serine protease
MPARPHYRSRLLHLLLSLTLLAGMTALVSLPTGARAGLILGGGVPGYLRGHRLWRRIERRIDRRNAVILYFAEGLTYALIVALLLTKILVKFVGVLRVFGVLWRYDEILESLLVLLPAFASGSHLALFRGARAYEFSHGPLLTKELYSRSVTGAEGMLGRRGRVRVGCTPRGKVEIAGEIWDASAIEGLSIEANATIVVRDIEGLRLLVERVDPDTT